MKRKLRSRIFALTGLFIKEQLKEPIALFLIMIPPCALFYCLATIRQDANYFQGDYITASAWFYAYISASAALFGFAFYIIKKRESGLIRSFIHSKKSKNIFLCSHFFAHSLISIAYCSIFYLITKPTFGNYYLEEPLNIILRFYICFIMFCSIGVIFILLSIDFHNSTTLLYICFFCMLIFGALGANKTNNIASFTNIINPLAIASQSIMSDLNPNKNGTVQMIIHSTAAAILLLIHLRLTPAWSRY